MSMNNDELEQTNTNDKTDAAQCGPGCDCDTPGLGTKGKILVCAVVGLAAAAVLARGFMKKADAENDGNQQLFATSFNSNNQPEKNSRTKLWCGQLDALASLNTVATDKDAVFVFLPAGTDEEIEAMKKQIGAAADKIMSRGTTMGVFVLDKNAKDYTQLTSQNPAPCVLTMVKGRGMSVVAKDITEANLLQSIVTATRPASCGTAGCGPGGCQ